MSLFPLLFVSCNKEPAVSATGFVPMRTELNVLAEGGKVSVPYKVANPVEDMKVTSDYTVDWISGFEDTGTEVTFIVSANETDSERSALVTLIYADEKADITVSQRGPDTPVVVGTAFDIDIKEIGYDRVVYDILPEDKEMTYITGAIHTSYAGWDEENPDQFIYDELDWYAFLAEGNLSGYLAMVAKTGDVIDNEVDGLDADTEHVIYAFGISLDGEPLTELCYRHFTTEDIERSDNQLSIEIYDIKDRQASLNILTTNDDPYAYGATQASRFAGLTDEQICDSLLAMDLSGNVRTGNITGETFYNLQSDTEYVVFAFGFEAGKITTDLVKAYFTTESLVVSEGLTLEILPGPYFDIDEIVAEYPSLAVDFQYGLGRALAMIDFRPSEDAAGYLWCMYYRDATDPEKDPDSKILQDMEIFGLYEPYMFNYFNYGQDHTIVGACLDENGVYGPVARMKINITKDDVSPLDEFPADYYLGL